VTELQTRTGGCHCGKVRYEAQPDLTASVISCNCSICSRMGALLSFVPAERFKLLSGEDVLTDYQFAQHKIHHLFCSVCGIRSFARGTAPDGSAVFAVNVRCLDDVDLDALQVKHFDGKSV
jgi:hypothetical protein